MDILIYVDKKAMNRVAADRSKHNIITHFPKDPNCPICQQCKIERAPMNSAGREADALPSPQAFGDEVTCDHKVLNQNDAGRESERYAVVMQDNYTYWLQAYPVTSKSGPETLKCFQQFFGPQAKPKHIYSDNSGEIEYSCTALQISHDTS